jgi:tetratricopeptide (TPR) repeat protein
MIKPILYCFLIAQLLYCKEKTDNKIPEESTTSLSENSEEKTPRITGDTIKGDFNADKIEDYIEINSPSADEKKMKIFLGTSDQKFVEVKSFTVDANNFSEVENPMENLFISQGKPGEIQIGSSCCGNFKTTEIYTYKYLDDNWFLSETNISTVNEDFLPDISLTINDLSYSIDGKNANNKSAYDKELNSLKGNALSKYNQYLSSFKSGYKNKSLGKMNSIGFDEVAEMLYFNPLSEANVNDYNDIAFYNSSTKKGNQSSILLLKKIIEKYPDRVVAYLNLGDSYWAIDNKEFAKEAYNKYLELMKNQNKDLSKIPPRVEERIN